MMGDGTTKYMAELEAGDNILAVSTSGETRKVVLGRVKIEQRPMVKITGKKSTFCSKTIIPLMFSCNKRKQSALFQNICTP